MKVTLILLMLMICYHFTFAQSNQYCSQDTYVRLLINENGSFKGRFINYDNPLSGKEDYYYTNGTWKRKGNAIILSTLIQPNNDSLVEIIKSYFEMNQTHDSVTILFDTPHGIVPQNPPILGFGPVRVTTDNGDYYSISPLGKVVIPKTETIRIHGRFTDYELLELPVDRNIFKIMIKASPNNQIFREGQYFKNKKLEFISSDTLILDQTKLGLCSIKEYPVFECKSHQ